MAIEDAIIGASIAKADAKKKYVPSTTADLRYTQRRRRPTAKTKFVTLANRAGAGWTIPTGQANCDYTNSTLNYGAAKMFGDRCLRLKTLGAGTEVYAPNFLTTPINVADSDIRVFFFLPDVNFTHFKIVVRGATNFSTADFGFVASAADQASRVWQSGRWNSAVIPKSAFTGTADWSVLDLVRVGIVDGGTATELLLHGVEFVQRDPYNVFPNGAVIFTADDSHVSQYATLRPLLQARNMRATLFPVIDVLGTDSNTYMTQAQISELHDTYGYEIGTHCYSLSTHALGLPALTSSQRCDEFEGCLDWQDSNGFRSNSHAYPLGNHDAATEADVAKYFTGSRLASRQTLETATPPQRFALQAVNITAGASAIGALANTAHADHSVLIVMAHSVAASGDGNNVTSAVAGAVLDAIVSSGCATPTFGEYLAAFRLN